MSTTYKRACSAAFVAMIVLVSGCSHGPNAPSPSESAALAAKAKETQTQQIQNDPRIPDNVKASIKQRMSQPGSTMVRAQ